MAREAAKICNDDVETAADGTTYELGVVGVAAVIGDEALGESATPSGFTQAWRSLLTFLAEQYPPSLNWDVEQRLDYDGSICGLVRQIFQDFLLLLLLIPYFIYYNLFLLRLPKLLYENRVNVLLRAALRARSDNPGNSHSQAPGQQDVEELWTQFVSGLDKQWKIMSVACFSLLSVVAALLQVPNFQNSPVTEVIGVTILICALNGFLLCIIYIIHMYSLRGVPALLWAEHATAIQNSTYLNAANLLAAPSVWLAWTVALFIAFICSHIWRGPINHGHTSSSRRRADAPASIEQDPLPLSLGARLGMTAVFIVAVIHFSCVVPYFTSLGASDIAERQVGSRDSPLSPDGDQGQRHDSSPDGEVLSDDFSDEGRSTCGPLSAEGNTTEVDNHHEIGGPLHDGNSTLMATKHDIAEADMQCLDVGDDQHTNDAHNSYDGPTSAC